MSINGTSNDASTRVNSSSVEVEHKTGSPIPEDPEDSLVHGDGSASSLQSLCDSLGTVITTSTEKTQPLQKKVSPRKIVRKISTGSSVRAHTSLRKTESLISKFKFLLHKYNKSMQTIAQEQLSLKCMHENLSKLKKELLDTGKYSEDDLFFNSPNIYEVSTHPCLLDDGGENQIVEPKDEASTFDLIRLKQENKKLAMKLSELERMKLTERKENVWNCSSKVSVRPTTPRPTTPQSQEYVMSKELRSRIRSRNTMRLEYEKKLEEANSENLELHNKLQDAQKEVEEITRLNSFLTCEREMMKVQLTDTKKSLEEKNLEAKKYEDFAELVQASLIRLRGEYDEFQKENDSCREAIEELKKEYGEALAGLREASDSWKTSDEKFRKQEKVKDAIISDFVKLGVSYKKLRASLAELTRRNAELELKAGKTAAMATSNNCSSKCSRSRRSSKSKKLKIASDCRNIAVQAAEVKCSNPLSKLSAFVNKTLSSQQFSSGDTSLQKKSDEKDSELLMKLTGLHRKMRAVKNENARFVGKHKLLMKQLLRYEKLCHPQNGEDRKDNIVVNELPKNQISSSKNKHPEKQLNTEHGSEPAVIESTRMNDTLQMPKPGGHHRMVYVVRPAGQAKAQTKKAWLKTLWSKDSDPSVKPSLHK